MINYIRYYSVWRSNIITQVSSEHEFLVENEQMKWWWINDRKRWGRKDRETLRENKTNTWGVEVRKKRQNQTEKGTYSGRRERER